MGQKKKTGRAVKKAREVQEGDAEEGIKNAPHTFVFNRGNVGKTVSELIRDLRRVMEPFTASKLKARKSNVLKDFVNIAGTLHVTHFITFTKTEVSTNMKIMRLPRGPTLTFQVQSFSLAKDIFSSIKRPHMEAKQFLHHPLLVMNNLSGEGMQFKLMASMFQNMFPSINVNKVKLKELRRCVLINYNSEDKTLDVRHYNIKAVPVGVSRGMKKLIKSKVPNMAKYEDISDYLMKGGDASESEAELDGPHNEVILPQNLSGPGNVAAAKSVIRLTEIGPRLKLQLIKIEEGICDGDVLFHEFIQKTDEEIAAAKATREKRRQLKALRKKQQQENVKKKEVQKKRRSHEYKKATDGEKNDESEDDDIEYFKEAVGENPDSDLFEKRKKRKLPAGKQHLPFKKKRMTESGSTSVTQTGKFSKLKGKFPQTKEKYKGPERFEKSFGKANNFNKGKQFTNKHTKISSKKPSRGPKPGKKKGKKHR